MAHGVEQLDGIMELLPQLNLSILDGERSVAWWRRGAEFNVCFALSIGTIMDLCLSTDERDLLHFSIHCDHVMGAFAGDTIKITDQMASTIADHVYRMIEAGSLLS
jgi:hypothetical protein